MGRKVGAEPLLGGQAGSPSNTVVWAEAYLCTNGILIHAAILTQQAWAENWGLCPFFGLGS